jgi:predicted nucleic acid-binding protein
LISAERGKERASRFLQLVHVGRARILVPLPGSDVREEILAATEIVASLPAAKAAGVALGRMKNVHARLTVDAIVIATAALADAVVVTGDPRDFDRLALHFPGVVVLSA